MGLQQQLDLPCHHDHGAYLPVPLGPAAHDLYPQSLCAKRVAWHWLSLKVASAAGCAGISSTAAAAETRQGEQSQPACHAS